MKKIAVILAVLAIGAFLYFYMTREQELEPVLVPPTTENGESGAFRPNPQNATFVFEEGSVTLSGGRHEASVAPGSAFMEETTLFDDIAYGDLNNDNRTDAAVLLIRRGAGSGTFVYVAAFVSGLVTYQGTNAVFLGDRIMPQSITANGGVIRVNYLDRREDEPMAADPTIPVTREFVLRNGQLVQR